METEYFFSDSTCTSSLGVKISQFLTVAVYSVYKYIGVTNFLGIACSK